MMILKIVYYAKQIDSVNSKECLNEPFEHFSKYLLHLRSLFVSLFAPEYH